jgi:hypothetical protein
VAGPYTGHPKSLVYFGSILNSTWQKRSTAEIWQDIRAQNVGHNLPWQPTIFEDVNQMRAIAGQNVQAAKKLQSDPRHFAIDDTHIQRPPVRATGPGTGFIQQYMIRVGYKLV